MSEDGVEVKKLKTKLLSKKTRFLFAVWEKKEMKTKGMRENKGSEKKKHIHTHII